MFGGMALVEPVLMYCQLYTDERTSVRFKLKYNGIFVLCHFCIEHNDARLGLPEALNEGRVKQLLPRIRPSSCGSCSWLQTVSRCKRVAGTKLLPCKLDLETVECDYTFLIRKNTVISAEHNQRRTFSTCFVHCWAPSPGVVTDLL